MANQTVTTNANFIPEVWSTEIIATHLENKVMAGLVKSVSHSKNKGDTIYFPKPGRATAAAKVADTAITYSADTAGQLGLTINRQYYAAKRIEHIADVLSQPGMRRFYTQDLGIALSKELDSYLHSLGALFGAGTLTEGTAYSKAVVGGNGSTAWDGSASTNTGNGTAFLDAGLRKAIQTLEDADVTSQLNFVVPPVVKQTMLGIDRYVSSDFVSGKPVVNREFGQVYGVRLSLSTQCATVLADDSSTEYRAGLLFTNDAIVMASPHKVMLETDRDLDHIATKLVAHALYGARVYRPEDGIALIYPNS